jgi:hypothetical protein
VLSLNIASAVYPVGNGFPKLGMAKPVVRTTKAGAGAREQFATIVPLDVGGTAAGLSVNPVGPVLLHVGCKTAAGTAGKVCENSVTAAAAIPITETRNRAMANLVEIFLGKRMICFDSSLLR